MSCKNGDAQIVRILLHRKANVKVVDISGKSPLHLAAKSNKLSQGIQNNIITFVVFHATKVKLVLEAI